MCSSRSYWRRGRLRAACRQDVLCCGDTVDPIGLGHFRPVTSPAAGPPCRLCPQGGSKLVGRISGWADLEVDRQGNHKFALRMYERKGEGQYELMQATSTRERLLEAAN